MPDSSIMLELCGILDISANELLCGEVIAVENYNKEMENNLVEMLHQKEESDRYLLTLEWVIGILSVIVLIGPILIAGYIGMEEWQRTIVALSGVLPALVGLCFAMKIEQSAGYYECRKCGHRYVPTMRAAALAMHFGRTRYMRCSECGKHSWQRKVIKKK